MDLIVKDYFHMILSLALFLGLQLRKTWRSITEKGLETAPASGIFFYSLKLYLTLIFEIKNFWRVKLACLLHNFS